MSDNPIPAARPLETGWLADTPIGDTLLRRFLFNQTEVNEDLARPRGRCDRTPDVVMTDSGGPIFFFNQAVLLRPLMGADDPMLGHVDAFFASMEGRGRSLLSLWPTPDLSSRGWTLVGHPAFVARAPTPHDHAPPDDVKVEVVRDTAGLATVERVLVDGYPMPEAAGLPPGSVLPAELVDGTQTIRLGLLDGEPVASGLAFVGHGVVNLCGGATLPAARRRGVWESLVWARVNDAPDLPAVAYTSDYSRPGFIRMGFLPIVRFTLWGRW